MVPVQSLKLPLRFLTIATDYLNLSSLELDSLFSFIKLCVFPIILLLSLWIDSEMWLNVVSSDHAVRECFHFPLIAIV